VFQFAEKKMAVIPKFTTSPSWPLYNLKILVGAEQ